VRVSGGVQGASTWPVDWRGCVSDKVPQGTEEVPGHGTYLLHNQRKNEPRVNLSLLALCNNGILERLIVLRSPVYTRDFWFVLGPELFE
jgi:hypothetical protein